MKNLIIYDTKYGYTEKCVNILKQKLTGDYDIINISREKNMIENLINYEKIIIGGSIYMGQISAVIKEFCSKNLNELKTKKIGFFICCGIIENFEQHISNSFPEELIKNSLTKQCFGGELNPKKMNFFHRLITWFMGGSSSNNKCRNLTENIDKLAEIINKN